MIITIKFGRKARIYQVIREKSIGMGHSEFLCEDGNGGIGTVIINAEVPELAPPKNDKPKVKEVPLESRKTIPSTK